MRILINRVDVIRSIFAGQLATSGQDIAVLALDKRFLELVKSGISMSVIDALRQYLYLE